MARPPLAIGTYGEIWTMLVAANGKTAAYWRAGCRYRHEDGVTRPEERRGPTEAKAKANLKEHLTNLQGKGGEDLTGTDRFKQAAQIYLDKIERKRRGSTYDTKRRYTDKWVLPYLGEYLLRECTPARLNRYFEKLETAESRRGTPLAPNTRRAIRAIVSGVMQVAVLHGVFTHNPVAELEDIEGGPLKEPTAYDKKRAAAFFEAADADAKAKRSGLNDLLRFVFYMAVRIGEAFAVQWKYVNLTDEPIKVEDPWKPGVYRTIPPRHIWLNGTIVRVKGKGLVRHPPKAKASNRIRRMPEVVYMMLLVRKPAEAPGDEPVFPNGKLRWRDPNNTSGEIQELRERIGFDDFVSHIGRKTMITNLDAAGFTAREISDWVGKDSIKDTYDTYMGRHLDNPNLVDAIDNMYVPDTDQA
jgi:integrase